MEEIKRCGSEQKPSKRDVELKKERLQMLEEMASKEYIGLRGKMRRRMNWEMLRRTGDSSHQSLPASGGEGTQRVPRKVLTKDSIVKVSKRIY